MEGLEDESHARRAYLGPTVFVERREFPAIQPDLPGRRQVQPGQQREQSRFSGPRGTDNGDGLASLNTETDVR